MTGLKFRLTRMHHGLSARELAMALRVTEKTVRNWETVREVPEKAVNFLDSLNRAREAVMKIFLESGERFPYPPDMNSALFFFPELANLALFPSALAQAAAYAVIERKKEPVLADIESYREWLGERSDHSGLRREYIGEILCPEA